MQVLTRSLITVATVLVIGGLPASTSFAANLFSSNYTSSLSQFGINNNGTLSTQMQSVAGVKYPVGFATNPNNPYLYVAGGFSSQAIAMFTISSNGLLIPLSPATVSTNSPISQLAITASGNFLYTTNNSNNPTNIYSVAEGGLLTPVKDPDAPGLGPIAISPNDQFIVGISGTQLMSFALNTDGTIGSQISSTSIGNDQSSGMAFTPDGSSLYVLDNTNNQVLVFSVSQAGNITPLPAATVTVNGNPSAIAITPNGQNAYINSSEGSSLNAYRITNTGSLDPIQTLATSNYNAFVLSSDNQFAYATNSSNSNSFINMYTLEPDGALKPNNPARISSTNALLPLQTTPSQSTPVAAFSIHSGPIGSYIFNGSYSFSSDEAKITTYTWDFGDGTPSTTTTTPQVTHAFKYNGTYSVTLTVTDSKACTLAAVTTGLSPYCKANPTAQMVREIDVSGITPPIPIGPPPTPGPDQHPNVTGNDVRNIPAAGPGGPPRQKLRITARKRLSVKAKQRFNVIFHTSQSAQVNLALRRPKTRRELERERKRERAAHDKHPISSQVIIGKRSRRFLRGGKHRIPIRAPQAGHYSIQLRALAPDGQAAATVINLKVSNPKQRHSNKKRYFNQ